MDALSERLTRPVRRALCAALVGVCLVFGTPATSATVNPIAQAIGLDFQGCPRSARAVFETLLADGAKTLSPRDLIDVQKMLLESCVDSFDVECMLLHVPIFEASVRTLSDSDEDTQWAALYWAILKLRIGDKQPPTSQDIFRLVVTNVSPLQPTLYIESHLWQAESLIGRGDVEGSRVATERALSLVLTLRQPHLSYTARWLIRICSLLARAGDVVRAVKLAYAAGPLQTQQRGNSLGATRDAFELVGRLSERVGEFQAARLSFEGALRLTDIQELPESVKASFRDWYLTELAATCIVSLDLPCARNALEQSSRAKSLAAGTLNERNVTEFDLAYMAAHCLLNYLEDRPLEPHWLRTFEALRRQDTKTESLFERLNRESLLAGAAGVSRFEAKDSQVERDIETFILKRLEMDRLESQLLPDATTLPSGMDRVYLRFGLRALRSLSIVDQATTVDLSLRVAQAANRSLNDAEGDALALRANLSTEYDRRSGHALLRLTARQSAEELTLLTGLVAVLVKGEPPPGDSVLEVYDRSARARLADLGKRRELLRGEVIRALSQSPAVSRNVSLAEVQSVLRPGEAVVVMSDDLGNAVHVAVTRDDSLITLTPVNWGQVSTDIRFLWLALTAAHPASELLDSSYPVAEANRLYGVMLGPVEKFLQKTTHLIWIPPYDILPLPLNALLRTSPPQLGRGFDLSKADFVIKRFEISLATSLKAFVASRKSPTYGHDSRSFFGAGDPELTGLTTDGVERRSAVSRGGRNLAADTLGSLPDVPETGDELREIGQSFGESATILTKLNATEASVRRRLLSDYSVIEFATHGLVKEGLKGLTESALVLTPQFSDRSEDDGLLTASEIADFDLGARLAVLSACNTAQSDSSLLSDEVHGLTNAFTLAGVPASLVTLWPVNSEVARTIVAGALTRLNQQHVGPASGLTQSMRSFLSAPERPAFLHPRFWAPFAIVGDGGDVEGPRAASGRQWRRLAYRVFEERRDGTIIKVVSLTGRRFLTAAVYGSGEHSTGVIELVDAFGATVWKRDYPGWSPIKLAARGDTVAALGLELRQRQVIPVVRAFTASGREIWQRDIDDHHGDCLPIALTSEPDGTWRLVLSAATGQPGVASLRSFITATLSSSGEVRGQAEIPVGEGNGAFSGVAVRRGAAWLLVLQGWTVNSQLDPVRTSYGESEECREIPRTIVGDISDSDPKWHFVHAFEESLNAADALLLAGRLVLAGSTTDRCQSLQFASIRFLSVDGGESSEAFNRQPLKSHLVRLFQRRGDGTLLGVGLSERIGDPGGHTLKAAAVLGRPAPETLPGDPWEDVVVMGIDAKRRFGPEMWFEAGTSIGLEDAALADDDILYLVGSIGSKGFVASYEWNAHNVR